MEAEKIIAMHCGPTLAGIKPANIVSVQKKNNPDIKADIGKMNTELGCKGIVFDVLCECENRILLFVYNKQNLYKYINKREIADLLGRYGYPETQDIDGCIEYLKRRIAEETEFPHEIGAFLGYPIEDICGFIEHKNDGCMYTGYWKVYSNVERAKILFAKYDRCREYFMKLLNSGARLADLVAAG